MPLPVYTDEITINEDGSVTGWACALNDHLDAHVPLQECAAPRGECPRGYKEAFECQKGERATKRRKDGDDPVQP